MKRLVAALVLALSAGAAPAQLIYRCGDSYSQTPCPGGRVLESSDPRTAAQRAEARRAAARDHQLATRLQRDRLAREAIGAATRASGFATAPPAKPADSPPAKRTVKSKPKPRSKPQTAQANDSHDFVAAANQFSNSGQG